MSDKVISIEDRIPKLKEQRKKKTNRRLIILLSLFFLFIISFIYIHSPVSRVSRIEVKGNHFVPDEKIIETSGITSKTIVLNIKKKDVKERLINLNGIKSAEMHIRMPNRVSISVEEYEPLGYLFENGRMELLLENGQTAKIENKTQAGSIGTVPVIKKFRDKKMVDKLAAELKKIPTEIRNSISEIIHSPKKTDPYCIILFMNDGNEVHATLRTFSDKMKYYPEIIKQLDSDVRGVIDLEVGLFFKPYDAKEQGKGEKKENEN